MARGDERAGVLVATTGEARAAFTITQTTDEVEPKRGCLRNQHFTWLCINAKEAEMFRWPAK